MDITTIGGFIFGITMLLVAQALEGGNVGQLIQLTAAMIVIGGTAGAVIASYPIEELKAGMEHVGIVFSSNDIDFNGIIKELVAFATKARKEGVITLEKEAKNASDPLLKVGLEAVSDGADPSLVRDLMETQLAQLEEKASVATKMWEGAGAFAPTFGIIGAVLGLIQVMQNLSDPSKLGAGIAVAFVATVYGLVTANLIYIPMSTKIKVKMGKVFKSKEMMIEGVLSIQAGESPALIERKLQAFLTEKKEEKVQGAAKEARA